MVVHFKSIKFHAVFLTKVQCDIQLIWNVLQFLELNAIFVLKIVRPMTKRFNNGHDLRRRSSKQYAIALFNAYGTQMTEWKRNKHIFWMQRGKDEACMQTCGFKPVEILILDDGLTVIFFRRFFWLCNQCDVSHILQHRLR